MFFEGGGIFARMFPIGEGPRLFGGGKCGAQGSVTGSHGDVCIADICCWGRALGRIRQVSSTRHLLTLCCVLGTGIDVMAGEESPRSCVPDGVACSAVEFSCTFLYLDSIFVKQEDLFDRALVFHL